MSFKKNERQSNYLIDPIEPRDFHNVAQKLRKFFEKRGFVEVPTQHRLSILAACEDPRSCRISMKRNDSKPRPQTGLMWLE